MNVCTCILCGTVCPPQWRWRKTSELQDFARKFCVEGPFVWPTLMGLDANKQKQAVCCVWCVYQMRKRSIVTKRIVPVMWPMDSYCLWLMCLCKKPDMRQIRRLSKLVQRQPSLNAYIVRLGHVGLHVTNVQSWYEYNLQTQFFRRAETAAIIRRLFKD